MKIDGKGRMLLFRWSGYDMAEDSLTYKDHLKTDYTGLQAQLTRRRTELKEATPTGSIRQVYTRMQVRSNRRQKGSKVGHARTGPNSREMEEGGRRGSNLSRMAYDTSRDKTGTGRIPKPGAAVFFT